MLSSSLVGKNMLNTTCYWFKATSFIIKLSKILAGCLCQRTNKYRFFLPLFTLRSLLVKVDRARSGVKGKILFSPPGPVVRSLVGVPKYLNNNFWNFFFPKLCISLELEIRLKNRKAVHQPFRFYSHRWKACLFILKIVHPFFCCSEKYILVNKLLMISGHLK